MLLRLAIKWKKKGKYHTVGPTPKSNIKNVERDAIDSPNAQIHARSLFWLGAGTTMWWCKPNSL